MTPQDIQQCWNEVFPNSNGTVTQIMGALFLRGHLAKDLTECPNRIIDNDPLMYVGCIREDVGGHTWSETNAHLYIKPVEFNRVYSSAQLRRKTIKNVTREKLVKRFQEVRKFVMDNAANLKDPLFDITTK